MIGLGRHCRQTEALSVQKNVQLGLLAALGTIFSYVEFMLPSLPLPGVKLGLANLVTLVTLHFFGLIPAVLVTFIRVLLSTLLSGKLLSAGFWMSMAGGLLSTLVMAIAILLAGRHLSWIGVSVLGGISHNTAQLLVAFLFLQNTGVFFYLSYLIFFGLLAGIIVGIAGIRCIKILNRV